MTLLDFVKILENVALEQPGINQIIPGDVYILNSKKDAEFGVFAWQHRQHTEDIDGDYRLFSFTLFYIDRETQDLSNILEAQSFGLETLSNIIRTIVERIDGVALSSNAMYQPFQQRFSQECAGTYANVTFIVPNDCICPEEY